MWEMSNKLGRGPPSLSDEHRCIQLSGGDGSTVREYPLKKDSCCLSIVHTK